MDSEHVAVIGFFSFMLAAFIVAVAAVQLTNYINFTKCITCVERHSPQLCKAYCE